MAAQIETTLRGPQAFTLARTAVAEMEAAGVWPTPLNFELWLHYLSDPQGALGKDLRRLLDGDEPFTEAAAELLAAEHLPRARLSEEIRDAGLVLNRELSNVSAALSRAQQSQAAYGATLAEASAGMDDAVPANQLKKVVKSLATATSKAQREAATLEGRLEASTREVSKLREHLEQVRRDAMTDALTNLANRKAFDEELERLCAEAQAGGTTVTLAVVDIDHFKSFNDTWGHQTGDQVLRYVGSVLARLANPPRVAARYGGEEFAVIFPGEDAASVTEALNVFREEVAGKSLKRRSTNDDLGAVTLSVGVAQRAPSEAASNLFDRADKALYVAKRGGRNRVVNAEASLLAA
ncbi:MULTISPECIES: GGDEF domain-containing protein [Brevundimonas]|uniref:GGDEF domain-containing protein n=1 Tax=Brevundimonas TaxID=41275 RepID=UPI000F01DE0A|nr:GGDEF domain-containing protein [Brevundimonas lutea]